MARIEIVVVAASYGGLVALTTLVRALPAGFKPPLFIVRHIGSNASNLPELLAKATTRNVVHARAGQPIALRQIYVAPPNWHMRLKPGVICLDQGAKVHHTRPAADPLFQSAAAAYGAAVAGVVLTGGGGDGAIGLRVIKENGGVAIVQDPAEAPASSMPLNALAEDHPDFSLPVEEIAVLLGKLSRRGDS